MNAAPPTSKAAAAQVPGSGMGAVWEMLKEADLTNDKFAGVGNFPAGCGANLARLDRADGGGMPVERHELHLVGLAIGINMHHRPDITRFKTVHRQSLGEDHSVMFFDHGRKISQRVGADQPRALGALVDDPNTSDGSVIARESMERTFDHVFCPVDSFD